MIKPSYSKQSILALISVLTISAACNRKETVTLACNTGAGYSVVNEECVCTTNKIEYRGACIPPNRYRLRTSTACLDSLYFHFSEADANPAMGWNSQFSSDPNENGGTWKNILLTSSLFPMQGGDSIYIKYINTYCNGGAEYSVFTGRFNSSRDSIVGKFYAGVENPNYSVFRGEGIMWRE